MCFFGQATVDHHVIAMINRRYVPHARANILPCQFLLRLPKGGFCGDRIDQSVIFMPCVINHRSPLCRSAVTANLDRTPYKERVCDFAQRTMDPISAILSRTAGNREIVIYQKMSSDAGSWQPHGPHAYHSRHSPAHPFHPLKARVF